MHQYCKEIVRLDYINFPDVINETDEVKLEIVSDDSKEPENLVKDKPRKVTTARIAKVKIPSEDSEHNEPIKILEIEPSKFSEKLSKLDKELKSPGPDKELGKWILSNFNSDL